MIIGYLTLLTELDGNAVSIESDYISTCMNDFQIVSRQMVLA